MPKKLQQENAVLSLHVATGTPSRTTCLVSRKHIVMDEGRGNPGSYTVDVMPGLRWCLKAGSSVGRASWDTHG